jgi:hypothetical protein
LRYGKPRDSWRRLVTAYQLDKSGALKACSWGSFQILGENYAQAASSSVEKFVMSFSASQKNQIAAFVAFIKNDRRLLRAIRDKDWTTFARIYNGQSYAENHYDTGMANHYRAITGGN